MKPILALLVCLPFAFLSCQFTSQGDEDMEVPVVKDGPVVISFKNLHDIETKFHFYSAYKNDTTWIGKLNIATLYYDDTQASLNNFSDKPDLVFDTLTISPSKDYQVFRHTINYFDRSE